MLQKLAITDFVLFAQCEVSFASGLNVLTGETGAGKSLLLQAISLIAGARADASLLREGAKQAQIIAEFSIENADKNVKQYLDDTLSIDAEDTLIIRRTIKADGKSKAYVNDVPVVLGTLKTLGKMLVTHHSQHDQRGLTDTALHRDLLDAEIKDQKLVSAVSVAYQAFRAASTELQTLKQSIEAAKKESHYLQIVVDELGALAPEETEETRLVEARARYLAFQKNTESLQAALNVLEGSDPLNARLSNLHKMLSRASLPEETQTNLLETVARADAELQEVSAQISDLLYQPQEDAESLAAKEDRLFALRAAARKYQVTVDDLAGFYNDAREKLDKLETGESQIKQLETQFQQASQAYNATCDTLREAREKTAESLFKRVHKELKALNMADAKLSLKQTELPENQWGTHGNMQVQFDFTPNKGQGAAPLSKIASGGELSRLLLAMSVVMKGAATASSVVYDEIDAGTSGAVAEAIGIRLKQLSSQTQVLVITHLPQVAAHSQHHIVIEKHREKTRTVTALRTLNEQEREAELARLLSGKVVTDEARQAAQKLLQTAS